MAVGQKATRRAGRCKGEVGEAGHEAGDSKAKELLLAASAAFFKSCASKEHVRERGAIKREPRAARRPPKDGGDLGLRFLTVLALSVHG